MPAPAVPSAPAAASYGESPKVQIPLGGGPGTAPIKVQMSISDAGQDVRDRGVAHIATGGLTRPQFGSPGVLVGGV